MPASRDIAAVESLAERLGLPRFSAGMYAGFPKQRAFGTSKARRKVADCSRRSGKSKIEQAELLGDVIVPPFTNVFYVTNTLKEAKKIMWPGLKEINREYGLGGVPNETECYIEFPGLGPDVHLYLAGAKDAGAADKLRGTPAKKYVIDEAQSMPDRILRPLLKSVIGPALMDYGGSLSVTGTPGTAKVGYFYDICHGDLKGAWEYHHWTWRDNTKLPRFASGATIEDIEREILEEHGWTRDDPTYLREYCGIWATDMNARVFKFDESRNTYTDLPDGEWSYVIGVDLGFDDADAIAVLGWLPTSPTVYLVEEMVMPKQGITPLMRALKPLVTRYQPRRTWIDAGGLGKKISVEIRNQWHVPLDAAEKTRKLEHIELLNDALRTGNFKVRPGSQFAEDCMLLQWDSDALAKGERVVDDGFHSDICDAALYAFRSCRAYLYEPPIVIGEKTPGQVAAELEAQRLAEVQKSREQAQWELDSERWNSWS